MVQGIAPTNGQSGTGPSLEDINTKKAEVDALAAAVMSAIDNLQQSAVTGDDDLQTQIEKLQDEIDRVRAQADKKENELTAQIQKLQAQLGKSGARIEALKAKLDEAKARIQELKAKLKEASNESCDDPDSADELINPPSHRPRWR